MTENFIKFQNQKIGPKPTQKPHPKILLGGFSPKTFERMVEYGDGYIGALGGSFEYFENYIKMDNDLPKTSTR